MVGNGLHRTRLDIVFVAEKKPARSSTIRRRSAHAMRFWWSVMSLFKAKGVLRLIFDPRTNPLSRKGFLRGRAQLEI